VPTDVRGQALAIVTAVVVVFARQWAEKFFIPLLLGIIIAYTLNPLVVVVWLERMKIPRVVGTSMVMLAVLGRSAFVTISLRGQIQTILDQLPETASKWSVALLSMQKGQPTTMQKVQAAARARSIRQPARRRISTRHPSSLRPTSSLTSPRSSWATS
jgi:predicted PurR-regulated permease PerM